MPVPGMGTEGRGIQVGATCLNLTHEGPRGANGRPICARSLAKAEPYACWWCQLSY